MADQRLLDAVVIDEPATKQGILQKLFAVWFDSFVYNQVWEDPRVDIAALEITPNSNILTISSGGCNALNYLLEDPHSVTAVDLNRYHIYLLELKIAAAIHLPSHEDFYEFFGEGYGPRTRGNYEEFVSSHLSAETREFWGSNSLFGRLVHGDRIDYFTNGGLYEHSRNAYFLRFFHWLARRLGCDPAAITKADGLEEQGQIYVRSIKPFFDSRIIRLIGKMPITLFGLGIPPQQFEELKQDLSDGRTLIDIFEERARRLACEHPIRDNYFAWQAFSRKYDGKNRIAVPEYLKQKNFDKLRATIPRLTTVIGSATDVIRDSDYGTFDRIVLLDAQDWMDRKALNELWEAIAQRTEPGARMIFRTAQARSPLEQNLPAKLIDRFSYEKETSETLFRQDRASIYGGFHLYVKK